MSISVDVHLDNTVLYGGADFLFGRTRATMEDEETTKEVIRVMLCIYIRIFYKNYVTNDMIN